LYTIFITNYPKEDLLQIC